MIFQIILFSLPVTIIIAIQCYSGELVALIKSTINQLIIGMQGSVNGDTISQLELIDCNGTDFCIK